MKRILILYLLLLPVAFFGTLLFDNFNIYAVQNFPRTELRFSLTERTRITSITTYHWNYGNGEQPGTLSLRDQSGNHFGPWQAYAESGQGGVPNTYWIVTPDIILNPGTYTLQDSSHMTWSWNAWTNGLGMAKIEGEPVKAETKKGAFFGFGVGKKSETRPEQQPSSNQEMPEGQIEQTVYPSSFEQTIPLENGISVRIPGNTLKKETKLTVKKPDYTSDMLDDDFDFLELAGYDIKLGEQEEFLNPIEIEVPYDPDKLNPDYTPGQQILARRWDTKRQEWVYLPRTVDVERQVIKTKTDHLSLIGWIAITAIIERGHAAYEYVFLDEYIDRNFIILYKKKAIKNNKGINNTAWQQKGGFQRTIDAVKQDGLFSYPTGVSGETLALEPLQSQQLSDVPYYIRDLGAFLNDAYQQYKKHFQEPPVPIIVKVDSEFIKATGARGAYEKLYRRIHVNTKLIQNPDMLKFTSAHELFHAFQNHYYTKAEMSSVTGKAFQWWLESTADWAACNIAWPKLDMMGAKAAGINLFFKQLEYPLDYLGSPDGLAEDLEYDRAYLIDYFDREGADIVNLLQYVAKHKTHDEPVFGPLKDYFMLHQTYNTVNFKELFRDYASFFLLSTESPCGKKDPYSNFTAITDVYSSGKTKSLTRQFHLEKDFTSKLWGIKIERQTPVNFSLQRINTTNEAITADVFVLPGGDRTAEYYRQKTGGIDRFFETVTGVAQPGDVVFVVITNTSTEKAGTLTLTFASGELKMTVTPEKIEEKGGELDHSFQITLEETPPSIKQIRCEWYTSEDPDTVQKKMINTPSEKTTFEIQQKFSVLGNHKLYIKLYETTQNKKSAEAVIEVDIDKMGSGFDCGVDLSQYKKVEEKREIYYVDSAWNMQGPFMRYYDDGRQQLKARGCYKDDYPVGHWTEWYPNGNKSYDGYYNDNHMRENHWDFWYEDGTPHSSGDYTDGKPTGNWVWYYANGKKEMQGTMNDGQRNGSWKEWYQNGNLKFEGAFSNGTLNGPFESYQENGTLDHTGSYNMGDESGFWDYYEKGTRYKSLDYDNTVTIYYKDDGQEVDDVQNW